MIGREAGWSHSGLVMSSVFEILSLLSGGSAIAIIGLAMTGLKIGVVSAPVLLAPLAGLIGLGFLLVRVAPRLMVRRWPELANKVGSYKFFGLWPTMLLHAAFFLIAGAILLLVCQVVLRTGIDLDYWPALLSLFAIAWTAGVITPGAPSGFGIRESVLVLGLAPIAAVPEATIGFVKRLKHYLMFRTGYLPCLLGRKIRLLLTVIFSGLR